MNLVSANIVLLATLGAFPALAQSVKSPDIQSLRIQWESIADSVFARIPPTTSKRVVLVVEALEARSTIENAFLSFFERKGMGLIIAEDQASAETRLLRISGISTLENPPFRISCDARWEEEEGNVRYLGRFHSESPNLSAESGPSGVTVMERIFEPLVVITGAILVVYLFFTIRS